MGHIPPQKSNKEIGFGVLPLGNKPEHSQLVRVGSTWPPGPVSAVDAGGDPAVFTYRELLPMGTVTQAVSAFAVSIGRRRLQPSDKSFPTEVGALPTMELPLELGSVPQCPVLVGIAESLAAHLLRRKRLRSHCLLLVCI